MRFIRRFWNNIQNLIQHARPASLDSATLTSEEKALRRELHKTIAKVTDDIGRRQTFNTAIAAIMELLNKAAKLEATSSANALSVLYEVYDACVVMLYPIIPHVCYKLWEALGHSDIDNAAWPKTDDSALIEDEKLIVIQVNGKVRSRLTVSALATEEEIKSLAFADPAVTKFTDGTEIKKVIFIKGKLLNIVVA